MSQQQKHAHSIDSVWCFDVFHKITMAVTGLILFGFLIGHFFGNLYALQGSTAYNQYYQWLSSNPIMHWLVRLAFIIAVPLHIWSATSLAKVNRKARPIAYLKSHYQTSTIMSRSMILSGVIFLLFLTVHLSQMKWGLLGPGNDSPWDKLQWGLENAWVVTLYVLGLLALAAHLFHGLWSVFQTLSLNNPRSNPWRLPFALLAGPVFMAAWLTLLFLLLWNQ